MAIPLWRLALTGGAIVILVAAGLGFVAAAGSGGAQPKDVTSAAATAKPDASAKPDRPQRDKARAWARKHPGAFGLLKAGRHLVHAEVTVTDKDGNLVTLQFDHGTISAIDSDSVSISEQGGSTVTVALDDQTRVRLGRQKGSLADLAVGDEVFVQSRIDGGSALAKHILEVPKAAGG